MVEDKKVEEESRGTPLLDKKGFRNGMMCKTSDVKECVEKYRHILKTTNTSDLIVLRQKYDDIFGGNV